MKRAIVLLVVGLFMHFSAWAQPTFSIPGGGIYNPGEEICFNVTIDDFTDLLKVQYSIRWDPEVLEFNRVEGFNMADLDTSHFDLSLVQQGAISLSWEADSGEGLTLPDNISIFQLCFNVVGECGGYTDISIGGAPTPIEVFREGAANMNINLFKMDGNASVCAYPVIIEAEEVEASPEEQVCVSVDVTRFTDIEGMEFTLEWDTSIIQFNRFDINGDIPFLSNGSFGTTNAANGRLSFSWFVLSNEDGGITLPDGTTFFDVCFDVVGESGDFSPVDFVGNIEVTTRFDGGSNSALARTDNGRVTISEEDGAVTIQAGQEVVPLGGSVCVPVRVQDFFAVDGMAFSMSWRPDTIRLDSIIVEEGILPDFGINNFNLNNTASGILTVDWALVQGAGALMDNEVLFEACYTAIGPGGSTSPITFPNFPIPPFIDTVGSFDNAGLNTRNGLVTILQPQSLNLAMTSATVQPGESFCVDVTATNFEEILSLQNSFSWETGMVEFESVSNFGLNGLDETDFNLNDAANGILTLAWDDPEFDGETLADGTVLFSICLRALDNARLGQCSEVFFPDFPTPTEATTVPSNGTPIEVTTQVGEVCIYDPDGFSVVIPQTSVNPDSSLCVPVRMTQFDDLEKVQFSINWNPSIVSFAGVNNTGTLPNIQESSFDLSQADIGVMSFSWTNATGVTLQDSTVVFELCFDAVGERTTCTAIDITSNPLPFDVLQAGNAENISLNPLHGEICINDAIYVDDFLILPPSCATTEDGSIQIFLSGGQEPYNILWNTEPAQFNETAVGLPTGTYQVTIQDQSGLTETATIEIEAGGNTPVANAGMDRTLTCGETVATLDGTRSTVSDSISYRWTVVEGDGFVLNGASSQSPLISGEGIYELRVTNDATGCFSVDSVTITENLEPVAVAGPDTSLTCATTSITLDGSASDFGDNISYRWQAFNGGVIESGDTLLNPVITAPGVYVLEVSHSAGCNSVDSLIVEDLRGDITAEAGPSLEYGCGDASVVIDGSASSTGENIVYQWTAINGGTILAGSDSAMVEIGSAGTYQLEVEDLATGCTAMDTVLVTPDEEAATINFGNIRSISCRDTLVNLNTTVANTDTFNIQWTTVNGSILPGQDTMLVPQVDAPGTYQIQVTNLDNGCTTTSTVEVQSNFAPPTAEAGNSPTIGCATTATVTLNALNGSSEGQNIQYEWSTEVEDAFIVSPSTAMPNVDRPGVYYLTVTDRNNGCTAVDSVLVLPSEDFPSISIQSPAPIPCGGGTTTIDASGSEPGATYQWTVVDGNGQISDPNEAVITVNEPGTYLLRVRNDQGCEVTEEVVVEGGEDSDVAVETSVDNTFITCVEPEANLTSTITPSNGDYTYTWSNITATGPDPDVNDTPNTTVFVGGLYVLEVMNESSGCVSRDTILVESNLDVPEAVTFVSQSLSLDCTGDGVTLDGSPTFMEPTFVAEWSTENGNITGDPNALITTVDSAGVYYLTITDDVNGCFVTDSVVVELATTVTASIETPDTITCGNPRIALRANSGGTGAAVDYLWSTEEGTIERDEDTAFPIVTAAGTYTVTITDPASSCTDVATVTVAENVETPTADAGQSQDLACASELMLSGAGTSTGDNFTYRWTTDDGSFASETDNPAVTISGAGTYRLVVIDQTNSCSDTSTVMVTQDVELTSASVDRGDITICTTEANLAANLPPGTMGEWSTSSNAFIQTPMTRQTVVNGLQDGEAVFVWTLSTDQCPDYSSDSVRVFVQPAPIANNDVANFDAKDGSININVTNNDILQGFSGVETRLVTKPSIGEVTSFVNGAMEYTASPLVDGEEEFIYEVCNSSCPDRCDSALVRIILESDPDAVDDRFKDLPNAITPNGDGTNDQLVFDFLEDNPDSFPDNQLIIFNRWGDILYEAQPYGNDWSGLNEEGKELPQATYYYILRLNIAEGLIIKGDITILK